MFSSGFTGGSYFNNKGGGVNYQCMPLDPEYNSYSGGGSTASSIGGTEYESQSYGIFPNSAFDQNAPCARCYTQNRPASMMLPAKRTCPGGWTKEYEGTSFTSTCGNLTICISSLYSDNVKKAQKVYFYYITKACLDTSGQDTLWFRKCLRVWNTIQF